MGEIRESELIKNNEVSEAIKDAGAEIPVEEGSETYKLPLDCVDKLRVNLIDSGFNPEAVKSMNQKLEEVPKCDLMSVIGDCKRELLNHYSPSSTIALKMILEKANNLNAAESLADQRIEGESRRGVSYPGAVKAESGIEPKSAVLSIEKEGIPLHMEEQTESLGKNADDIEELKKRRELSTQRADELREHLNKQKLAKDITEIAEKQESAFRPVKNQEKSFLTRIMSAVEGVIGSRSSKPQ